MAGEVPLRSLTDPNSPRFARRRQSCIHLTRPRYNTIARAAGPRQRGLERKARARLTAICGQARNVNARRTARPAVAGSRVPPRSRTPALPGLPGRRSGFICMLGLRRAARAGTQRSADVTTIDFRLCDSSVSIASIRHHTWPTSDREPHGTGVRQRTRPMAHIRSTRRRMGRRGGRRAGPARPDRLPCDPEAERTGRGRAEPHAVARSSPTGQAIVPLRVDQSPVSVRVVTAFCGWMTTHI